MKNTWSILLTTESYSPNFNGMDIEVKEFPISEELKNWLEVKKEIELRSNGLERTTVSIIQRSE